MVTVGLPPPQLPRAAAVGMHVCREWRQIESIVCCSHTVPGVIGDDLYNINRRGTGVHTYARCSVRRDSNKPRICASIDRGNGQQRRTLRPRLDLVLVARRRRFPSAENISYVLPACISSSVTTPCQRRKWARGGRGSRGNRRRRDQ